MSDMRPADKYLLADLPSELTIGGPEVLLMKYAAKKKPDDEYSNDCFHHPAFVFFSY